MIVQMLEYIASRYTSAKVEADKHGATGKLLTPWASAKLADKIWLSRNNSAYKIISNGDFFVVWDSQAEYQQRHTCSIDPASPGCSPCSTWQQFRIPCRHMIIAISQHNPTLLGVRKKFFVENFFHPAYHTANYVKAYANVSLNFPDAPSGKPLPDIDLTLDSEDDEDDAAPVVFSSSGGGAAASASGHGSSASGDSRGGKRGGGAGKAGGGGVDSEDDADLYAPLFFSNSDSDGEEGGGAPAAASHVGGGGGFGGGGAAGAGGVYASQVSHLHPDLQKQEADRLLRAGLLEFGMRVVTCEADGNCLFRAVAHQMYASEAQHAQVRRQAVEYMREHEDRFVFLVDPPTSNEF